MQFKCASRGLPGVGVGLSLGAIADEDLRVDGGETHESAVTPPDEGLAALLSEQGRGEGDEVNDREGRRGREREPCCVTEQFMRRSKPP